MHPNPLLFTLLASLSLAAAEKSLHCPLAMDGSAMIQNALCCRSARPAPHTEKSIEGVDCECFFLLFLWVGLR